MNKVVKDYITESNGKYTVHGHNGRHFGTYSSEGEAKKRLEQIEYFKHAKDAITSEDMEPGEMEQLRKLFGKFLGEEEKEPEHQAKDARGLLVHSLVWVTKGGKKVPGKISGRGASQSGNGFNYFVKLEDGTQGRFEGNEVEPRDKGAHDASKIGAGIVFMTPSGRVLLLRRVPEEKNYGGHWGLPGGKAEPGESPQDAAMREAKEETGFAGDFDIMSDLGTVDTPNGFEFTTYLVKLKEEFAPVFKDKEHDDHQWAALDNLPEPIHPSVNKTLDKLKGDQAADSFALDKDSVRSLDATGRLHVAASHISKAAVNPYLGKEIPGYEALGLDAEKIYQMLRCPEELAKAADTFNGIQILKKHIPVSVDDHQPDDIVGTTGTNATFNDPFLDNELIIWTEEGIGLIESGLQQELSCGYSYIPVMEPGNFKGDQYDGKMTNIKGNHVALVEKGRAGPEVMVGDEAITIPKELQMNKPLTRTAARVQAALSVFLLPKIAMDSQLKFSTALSTGLININRKTFASPKIKKALVKFVHDAAEPMLAPEAKAAGGIGPDDVIMKVLEMVEKQGASEPEEMDELPAKVAPGEEEEEEPGAAKPEKGAWKKNIMDALMKSGMDEVGCKAIMDMMPEEEGEDEEPKPGEGKTGDEEDDEAKKKAEDEEKEKNMKAMDSAIKAGVKLAEENMMKRLTAIREAERDVLPLIGEVSVAMDSAEDIYKAALKAHDVETDGVHPTALKSMVKLLAKTKEDKGRGAAQLTVVHDAAILDERTAFDKEHGIATRQIRNLG